MSANAVTAAQLPPVVRDAIARLVDYNWTDEERDYLDNCGNGPDDNARAGHQFEHLTLLRRWLEGHADGVPCGAGRGTCAYPG